MFINTGAIWGSVRVSGLECKITLEIACIPRFLGSNLSGLPYWNPREKPHLARSQNHSKNSAHIIVNIFSMAICHLLQRMQIEHVSCFCVPNWRQYFFVFSMLSLKNTVLFHRLWFLGIHSNSLSIWEHASKLLTQVTNINLNKNQVPEGKKDTSKIGIFSGYMSKTIHTPQTCKTPNSTTIDYSLHRRIKLQLDKTSLINVTVCWPPHAKKKTSPPKSQFYEYSKNCIS